MSNTPENAGHAELARDAMKECASLREINADLLAALRALMGEVEEMTARCGWAGSGARMHAQIAIAKAEGR